MSAINTNEYQRNSKIYKEEPEEKKKMEKVIQGEANIKKKSLGRKVSDTFIKEDFGNVKSYIFTEVIVPSIIDLISETLHNTVDMMFHGEAFYRRRSSNSYNNSRVNYNSIFKNDPRNNTQQQSYRSVVGRNSIDDIILDSRADAEDILNAMMDALEDYKMVSVADLYDMLGKSTIFTQNNIGWFDLSGARIERVREGYLLKLPRPTNLN